MSQLQPDWPLGQALHMPEVGRRAGSCRAAQHDDESALFLMHESVELHTPTMPVVAASAATMYLHFDEP